MPQVEFRYLTGIRGASFSAARLRGSWNAQGRFSDSWTEIAMEPFVAEDGCPAFRASVNLDSAEVGGTFRWGVAVDAPAGSNLWGVPTEVKDAHAVDRFRAFRLAADAHQRQDYFLTFARLLGARKYFGQGAEPCVRFSVWAPNARKVDVVFAPRAKPYIFDSGQGIDPARPALEMTRTTDGIWQALLNEPLTEFEGLPYMYRVVDEQGTTRYRTDVFSRRQAGLGRVKPENEPWDGTIDTLDGSKSCSLVSALDSVASSLEANAQRISREEFWHDEFERSRPVPHLLEELIIYELHVGGLGYGKPGAGTLRDAIAFVPYLADLGVTCVELMPINEFSGNVGWGYGQTHHFAFESSAGTLDEYRHFVRACHRQGIAVIQDVCYNHYDPDAERAQWQYDSNLPEHNIYFWYEGNSADHRFPNGGYLDNGSSGFAPRYHEEVVRQQFIASAALLMDECHVDGFRVDLTQAFHRDNTLHANGLSIGSANQFGQKLLREWARTLRLLNPYVMLIAEDHTGWDKVTESPDVGGLGFTARWEASFYHHLIGDADAGGGRARVLRSAGFGGDGPLELFTLARSLYESQFNRVVYHESHDECGNASGSSRTLNTAVGGAALVGATRRFAEARARVAFALSLFSAASPMFFMGEEVGAVELYCYDDFLQHREDLFEMRNGIGAGMFAFYQDAILLRKRRPALRAQSIDVIHVNPEGRVIAFVRRSGVDAMLVVACFANHNYDHGYVIQTSQERLPNVLWREVLNSDSARYGGQNFGNSGADIASQGGRFELLLPANGALVFRAA